MPMSKYFTKKSALDLSESQNACNIPPLRRSRLCVALDYINLRHFICRPDL